MEPGQAIARLAHRRRQGGTVGAVLVGLQAGDRHGRAEHASFGQARMARDLGPALCSSPVHRENEGGPTARLVADGTWSAWACRIADIAPPARRSPPPSGAPGRRHWESAHRSPVRPARTCTRPSSSNRKRSPSGRSAVGAAQPSNSHKASNGVLDWPASACGASSADKDESEKRPEHREPSFGLEGSSIAQSNRVRRDVGGRAGAPRDRTG